MDSVKEQLAAVEKEIFKINQEVQCLLQKQNTLKERRNQLKIQLEQEASAELANINWKHTDYPWSKKLELTMHDVFKLKTFRPLQLEAMNATLSGQDCILIMPTGGGKSLCYQLPALIYTGISLVVSPLVSLMEDQLMALTALKISAATLNTGCSKEEVNKVQNAMKDKNSDLCLLYVTPEKLAKSKRFMSLLEKVYEMGRFTRLAIDEVHCCSQWGHDFRPDYKFLGVMKRQFPKVPILGLTATATSKVVSDIQKMLNIGGCLVLKASYNRPNLKYEVIAKANSQEKSIDQLENIITKRFFNQSGIVYCFSIKEAEEVTSALSGRGIKALSYHAQLDSKSRSYVHESWVSNKTQVVVATVAFGMGIDKPDVSFVIHHSLPKSLENYYQESGRAGRNDAPAYCILLFRAADIFRQSTMVFTERTGLENLYAMVAYCLEVQRCRRTLIAHHFGEEWDKSHCQNMCDNCEMDRAGARLELTRDCKVLYTIIDHASQMKERLTANKLIEIWQKKGPAKLRPPHLKATAHQRDNCELILVFLLIEGYLKEEFHFNPFTTISYINKGPKAAICNNSDHSVYFCLPTRKDHDYFVHKVEKDAGDCGPSSRKMSKPRELKDHPDIFRNQQILKSSHEPKRKKRSTEVINHKKLKTRETRQINDASGKEDNILQTSCKGSSLMTKTESLLSHALDCEGDIITINDSDTS